MYDAHGFLGNNPQWVAWGVPAPLNEESWLQIMESIGLDGALVMPPGLGHGDDFKSDMESIALAVERHPGRFHGLCRVKPRRGQAALDDMRYWVEERGFCGLKINTADQVYRLDDRLLLDPVIELADRLGILVLCHSGDFFSSTCTPDMVADLAVDFPETTFVIGHMGHPGWHGGLVEAMRRAPNTVTTTGAVFRLDVIMPVVAEIGAGRILMGSHGPYAPVAMAPLMIKDGLPGVSDDDKQAILHSNFVRVLGLDS